MLLEKFVLDLQIKKFGQKSWIKIGRVHKFPWSPN